jgi:hypothetical protein
VAAPPAGALATGEPRLDAVLNGGLRIDGLHEFYAAGVEDSASLTGFALLIAHMRIASTNGRSSILRGWATGFRARRRRRSCCAPCPPAR